MKANILLVTAALATLNASAQFNILKDLKSTADKAAASTARIPQADPVTTAATNTSLLDGLSLGDGKSRIVVLGGLRLLGGQRDSVRIEYIDESPSHDYMSKTIDLSGSGTVTAITAYYERENDTWSFQAGIDGFISSYWSIAAFVGGSYHLVNKDGFKVKAGGRLAYGIGRVKLGDVENNSSFFQIGGQQIYDRELRLSYKDSYVALTPNITIEKSLSDRIGIIASAAGTIAVRTKAMIEFQGSGNLLDGANASEPAEVELNNVNLTMSQNGNKLDKLPLSYNGASLTIGLTYNL